MSQLTIQDLEFCGEEILENGELGGGIFFSNPSSGFFRVEFDVSQLSRIGDLSGEAGAGFGAAIAVGIGRNINIEIDTGVLSDTGLFSF